MGMGMGSPCSLRLITGMQRVTATRMPARRASALTPNFFNRHLRCRQLPGTIWVGDRNDVTQASWAKTGRDSSRSYQQRTELTATLAFPTTTSTPIGEAIG